MFRTIVLALLFVVYGIPLIFGILGSLFDEETNVGCRIFTVVIVALIAILI